MARSRCMPGRRSLACLVLVFAGTACSRGSSEAERGAPSANAAVSATATPQASVPGRRVRPPSRALGPPPPPAASPGVPPQLLACAGRSFYRITQKALQVFEASATIPPPHIRGSAAARQLTELEISEPLNVVTLGPKQSSVLVIAKREVFQYEPGQKQARALARIPTPGPLVAWADPRGADSFWVRVLGEQSLHHYRLSAPSSVREQVLPGFDARLFTVLDGAPFYSTPEGLLGQPALSKAVAFPEPKQASTLLFADSSRDRYWTADAQGNLGLWALKQAESPVFTARVPGIVIDAAQEGDRVAVLSMELIGRNYQPTVTVLSKGEQQGQLSIGLSFTSRGQPELDLCLLSGRPWVVVGGRHWVQVLDWTARRLLAEW